MSKLSWRDGVGTAAALGALTALTACGGGSGSGSPAASASAGGGAAGGVTLTAQNTAYQPASLSVAAGTQVTITFVNKDSVEHSLTFDDNSKSVDADGGETATLSFTSPASGTISFHCKYHPTQMRGTITVGSGM